MIPFPKARNVAIAIFITLLLGLFVLIKSYFEGILLGGLLITYADIILRLDRDGL